MSHNITLLKPCRVEAIDVLKQTTAKMPVERKENRQYENQVFQFEDYNNPMKKACVLGKKDAYPDAIK
jgi:hypothetical protein